MDDLELELKKLIIDALNLEDIAPEQIDSNEPLFGDGLGLDSIDALELGVVLRKNYGIKIASVTEQVKAHFANIHSLAQFIISQREESQ
ncbi:MAG TPA: acyl carrier protein [Rhodospirillaceae bacterium]|nr:acyl carrier protein [Rhodospirillaceae bacterium]